MPSGLAVLAPDAFTLEEQIVGEFMYQVPGQRHHFPIRRAIILHDDGEIGIRFEQARRPAVNGAEFADEGVMIRNIAQVGLRAGIGGIQSLVGALLLFRIRPARGWYAA